jgi:hypothetical protein
LNRLADLEYGNAKAFCAAGNRCGEGGFRGWTIEHP